MCCSRYVLLRTIARPSVHETTRYRALLASGVLSIVGWWRHWSAVSTRVAWSTDRGDGRYVVEKRPRDRATSSWELCPTASRACRHMTVGKRAIPGGGPCQSMLVADSDSWSRLTASTFPRAPVGDVVNEPNSVLHTQCLVMLRVTSVLPAVLEVQAYRVFTSKPRTGKC